MNEKPKMPPPGERRIIPASNAIHPALGPGGANISLPPGAIQPEVDAKPIAVAIVYIPAPGLKDSAPTGIYWATERGIVLSPAIQEPLQLEQAPPPGGEEKGERPEDARQDQEGNDPS